MKKTHKLSLMAMYAAVSVLAVAFIRIPLIPAAPFLVYDMADIPILMATLTLGGASGGLVLLSVCLIQAFLMGGDGVVGFVMHFVSTGAMVIIFSLIHSKWKNIWGLITAAAISTVAMTLVMIPMNLWLTVVFMGTPRSVVIDMLIPAIIPFNLIKAGLNSFLTVAVYKITAPIIKKMI